MGVDGYVRNAMNLESDRMIGAIIDDKYEILDLLGEGGMALVYRAVHRGLDREVAVKIMKGAAGEDSERSRRFEREARLASRLHHPHILSTIDFGRTPEGLLFIISEYVNGRMLYELIEQEGGMPLSRVFGLFHQILAAVDEAHASRVIHRDLKPENILVTNLRSGEDFVKVLDFGIAVTADGGVDGPRVTRDDQVTGTPGYMAPEQIMGLPATERSDIYSLGVILFQLLTGRLPFAEEGDGSMALMVSQLSQTPLTLAAAAPGRLFTDAMQAVVERAMAREPEDRFSQVAKFRDALARSFAELEPVQLACDSCTRPIDPLTGLCSLHGRDDRISALPRRWPTEAVPTRPSLDARPATRAALVEEIVGKDAARLVMRESEAAEAAAFLVGGFGRLEVLGEPGAGKSTMLEGIGRGAEMLGMRVIRVGPDPHSALPPWYPIRELVRGVLGLKPGHDDADGVAVAARRAVPGAESLDGLRVLFGTPRTGETGRALRRAARLAVADLLFGMATAESGLCILADDVHRWDRASQWLIRGLEVLGRARGLKLVLASEQGFLAGDDGDREIRLTDAGGKSPLWRLQAAALEAEGGIASGGVEDIIAERIERLPGEATTLLATVAVVGHDVLVELLVRLHGEQEALLALGVLERGGWVVSGPGRVVRPAHQLLAAAAMEHLDLAELRARHRAVGALLGESAGVFAAARHAVEGGDPERAVELLSRAGEEACRAGDEETAGLVHFQRARHLARWELLMGEDEEPYLLLSLKQARALAGSGHRLAAEIVLKEVIGNSSRYPDMLESARRGLESLSR